jgi:hypothetical protein
MDQKNIDPIRAIIDAIDIQPDRKLFHFGKELNVYGETPSVSNDMLQYNLQTLIYGHYYCRGEYSSYPEERKEVSPSDDSIRQNFVTQLQTANTSVSCWDYGWTVESSHSPGTFQGRKGNHMRILNPGEFIKDQFYHGALQPGELVRIWLPKESDGSSDSFYFAYGNCVTEDDHESLIRFYFNLVPEGAALLVNLITTTFNRYHIPFQFKCLNDPALYSRSDTAVLYLNKRYVSLCYPLLKGIHENLQPYFRRLTPLFTRRIDDGFAFAESPRHPGESFGTNRSRLIAAGIVHAFNEQSPKDQWVRCVTETIETNGYSLDHFHLNPGSRYPYPFEEQKTYRYAS